MKTRIYATLAVKGLSCMQLVILALSDAIIYDVEVLVLRLYASIHKNDNHIEYIVYIMGILMSF